MKTKVKKVLESWQSSLFNYGKLDSWKITNDLSTLGKYIRTENEDDAKVVRLVRELRDIVISPQENSSESISLSIKKILSIVEKVDPEMTSVEKQIIKQRKNSGSQVRRFKGVTRRIFNEKLKFKDGMKLRNFDKEMESRFETRLVRRIIEKRMSQACHKMSRTLIQLDSQNNIVRHRERRATSFQISNIGQIEDINLRSRGDSTHWRRLYDQITGVYVFKKKKAYPTEEAAIEAKRKIQNKYQYKYDLLQAYLCATCGKWHLGNNYPDSVHQNLSEIKRMTGLVYRPLFSSMAG